MERQIRPTRPSSVIAHHFLEFMGILFLYMMATGAAVGIIYFLLVSVAMSPQKKPVDPYMLLLEQEQVLPELQQLPPEFLPPQPEFHPAPLPPGIWEV